MMQDPLAALSIYAEVSVALIGFSGIVIAFGRRSRGELSRLESRRLSNLFACSGFALLLSLLGIAIVQHPTIDVRLLWKCGSATLFVVGTSWLIHDWWTIHRLEAEEKASLNRYIIYPFNFVAVLFVLLLLANVFVMAEAWPLFLGLAYLIAFALQQFILLIRMGYDDE
jgi:hypothetical protein